jgi:FAD:protein FMN transferase
MIQPSQSLVDELLTRVRQSVQVQAKADSYHVTCRAMSTPVRLVFRTPSIVVAREYQHLAIDGIARFEARYSRFLPQSIVGQINTAAGTGEWLEVDDETDQLFALCAEMHALTGGVFDAAALPLLKIWNWKADPPLILDELAIRAARAISGWHRVKRRRRAICLPIVGMGIDLGGIGKEYAVDQLIFMARQHDIHDVLVDIGQDIRVRGRPPGKDAWYIGLEEPEKGGGRCWTAVKLSDQAVASSGDYVRSFTHEGRRFGHILDPRAGIPVNNGCQAVSVVAQSCVLAGILSTAAFILGPVEGLQLIQQHGSAEACITTESARIQTRRFSDYVPL